MRKITTNDINQSAIYFLVNYLEREVMKIKQAKICKHGTRWGHEAERRLVLKFLDDEKFTRHFGCCPIELLLQIYEQRDYFQL